MDLSKNTIIGISCLLIGVCLQFCFGNAMWPFIAGSLLVMFGPMATTKDYAKDFYRRANDGVTQKWKDFDVDTTIGYIQALRSESIPPIREKTAIDGVLGFLGSLGMRIVGLLVAWYGFSSDDYAMAAIALDIPFIPYGLFRFKYGVAPGDAFSTKGLRSCRADPDKLFTVEYLLDRSRQFREFTMKGQLLVEHGERNLITDAKMALQYSEKYRNLLCGMISISMNKVQTKTFPYAYYVIVVKGQDGSGLGQALAEIVSQTVFDIECNMQDGNTVYVMTKKAGIPVYYTTAADLDVLIQIVSQSTYAMHRCLGVD